MKHEVNLMKDLAIIALSVVVAVGIVKSGALESLLNSAQEVNPGTLQSAWVKFLGSFVAGIFFVSIFSAAPATVVLAKIAGAGSVFWTAVFGGLGALLGDLIIFRFIKDRLAEDFYELTKKTGAGKIAAIFKLRLFKWLIPFFGALVVASPLPDELGLAMLGLSKMKTSLFVPLSFLLNFLGILAIGLVAKTAF